LAGVRFTNQRLSVCLWRDSYRLKGWPVFTNLVERFTGMGERLNRAHLLADLSLPPQIFDAAECGEVRG
jgi:hypothetical protein